MHAYRSRIIEQDAVYVEYCLVGIVFALEYQSSGMLLSWHEVQLKNMQNDQRI